MTRLYIYHQHSVCLQLSWFPRWTWRRFWYLIIASSKRKNVHGSRQLIGRNLQVIRVTPEWWNESSMSIRNNRTGFCLTVESHPERIPSFFHDDLLSVPFDRVAIEEDRKWLLNTSSIPSVRLWIEHGDIRSIQQREKQAIQLGNRLIRSFIEHFDRLWESIFRIDTIKKIRFAAIIDGKSVCFEQSEKISFDHVGWTRLIGIPQAAEEEKKDDHNTQTILAFHLLEKSKLRHCTNVQSVSSCGDANKYMNKCLNDSFVVAVRQQQAANVQWHGNGEIDESSEWERATTFSSVLWLRGDLRHWHDMENVEKGNELVERQGHGFSWSDSLVTRSWVVSPNDPPRSRTQSPRRCKTIKHFHGNGHARVSIGNWRSRFVRRCRKKICRRSQSNVKVTASPGWMILDRPTSSSSPLMIW